MMKQLNKRECQDWKRSQKARKNVDKVPLSSKTTLKYMDYHLHKRVFVQVKCLKCFPLLIFYCFSFLEVTMYVEQEGTLF